MTNRRRASSRTASSWGVLMLSIAVGLASGACAVAASPSSSTATPASSAPGQSATAGAPTSAPASAAASASLPGQTTTAWGRIWDGLPAAFPRYPGSSPATVSRGPASAELTVAADAAAVLAGLRTRLETAGYSTVTLSGLMEDGSRVLDSASSTSGCRVQTTVGPLGGLTYISVLFGAACPFA